MSTVGFNFTGFGPPGLRFGTDDEGVVGAGLVLATGAGFGLDFVRTVGGTEVVLPGLFGGVFATGFGFGGASSVSVRRGSGDFARIVSVGETDGFFAGFGKSVTPGTNGFAFDFFLDGVKSGLNGGSSAIYPRFFRPVTYGFSRTVLTALAAVEAAG